MDSSPSPHFRSLLEVGESLAQRIDQYFDDWPSAEVDLGGSRKSTRLLYFEELPSELRSLAVTLQMEVETWFNRILLTVLPYTTYDRTHVNLLVRRVTATLNGHIFLPEYIDDGGGTFLLKKERPTLLRHNFKMPFYDVQSAKLEAKSALTEALVMVRTAVPPEGEREAPPTASHVPNTAFILMWMDKAVPALVDVHMAVKEVFSEFGVDAVRADEVQHQDSITTLILERIRRAEFLFADLTGERPNVYYEVGYAHALGKRPILYRKVGTPLHFDLAVHNVPEYANVQELKLQLRERLSAITGRQGTPLQARR